MWDPFERLAPWYDRLFATSEPARLIALADLPVQGRLLDAGGGTGRITIGLRGFASQLVVADPSIRMVQQARGKGGLQMVCCPSERLPFPSGCFERVIMVDAWHHVRQHGETARELWRVLKPGGRLVIEEPDIHHWGVKVVALVEKLTLMRSQFFPPDRIAAAFPAENARVEVHHEGYIAWIVVEKRA